MADTEFEEFRQVFDRLPQYIKAPTSIYALVHDVNLDEDSPSTMSSSMNEDYEPTGVKPTSTTEPSITTNGPIFISTTNNSPSSASSSSSTSTVTPTATSLTTETTTTMINDNELIVVTAAALNSQQTTPVIASHESNSMILDHPRPPAVQQQQQQQQRRRRRLPEIPKNKKSSIMTRVQQAQPSLADELGAAFHMDSNVSSPSPHHPNSGPPVHFAIGGHTRPLLLLKCHQYLRDEDSSPDSERFQSTDVDSGNSTVHSPDGPKSTSPPLLNQGYVLSPSTPTSSALSLTNLEMLEATHRGLHKFIPRHRDEIEVEIGDPIYVQKEADDLWCEGVNLRTGRQGIFPSAYAVDTDYSDFDPATPKVKRERYLLGYLGSVETVYHKGTAVLKQAVAKMSGTDGSPRHKPHSCILEVSDQGLRMVDRNKPPKDVPCHDYFYSLKNVSFCAFHPRDHRYLGFITKHPQLQRFACHVFVGHESTRPVAESVGRAMQRFYTTFIEQAYPIEDIYIE